MSEPEGRLLVGTEAPFTTPFFSPDGQSVGYFQAGQLKRLAIAGGAPVDDRSSGNPFGVTWTSDNSIFFGQRQGIMRVSASGGAPNLSSRPTTESSWTARNYCPTETRCCSAHRRQQHFRGE